MLRHILLIAGCALSLSRAPNADRTPCEAYGAADAVFIGEAGPVVRRPVPEVKTIDGSVAVIQFSPVTVERAYRGVSTPSVFIHTVNSSLTPGMRYLFYGSHYAGTDMFMSDVGYGTKPLNEAQHDLEFLDQIRADQSGATITGTLEVDESDSAHIASKLFPLGNVTVQFLSSNDYRAEAVTAADGRFQITELPSGTYKATPILSEGLKLDDYLGNTVRVLSGGCGTLRLRAVPNGHVRGVLTTWDGRPAVFQTVSLMPAELKPGERDRYFQWVHSDDDGHFTFDGVRAGKYVIGRLAFTLNGIPVRAVYYPGTLDRQAAAIIVIGRAGSQDVGEFHIPIGGGEIR
jgi:hypothetical protein